MKHPKITKRDIIAFFLGLFTMILIEIITDWEGAKRGFKAGWKSVESNK